MTEHNQRYERTGGKYWGAKFEELCRGHRLRVLKPKTEPNTEIDLYSSPDGTYVGKPPDCTDCPLCKRRENEHGKGLHGISVYGCPTCGGEVELKQSVGSNSIFNYAECPNCVPPSILKRLVSFVKER